MRIISANISGSLTLNGVDVTNVTVSSSIWSGSMAGRIANLEQFSSSLDATYATDAQLAAATASLSASLSLPIAALNSYTSSNNTTIASLNTFSGSILSYTSSNDAKISALNAQTASLLAYTSSNDTKVTALNTFSSSILSYTSSNNANISSLNSYTSSATARFVGLETTTASLNTYTSSNTANITSLNSYTSSATDRFVGLEAATSSLNSFTSSANTRLGTLEAATASLNSYTSSATARFVGLEAATASLNSYTSSNTANITSLNSYTSSATARFVGLEAATSSLNTFTSSINSRVTVVESKYATTGSNTFTGQQYSSNTTVPVGFANTTASIYTDGGLLAKRDVYFSSSLYIKGDLIVYGTQSVEYITSSNLNISDNIITVNTATPSVRFGGLAVYDSGSTGLTGSLLWDSQNNNWLYSNPTGSGNYDSSMVIMGPRNSSALGNEAGLTCNYLVQGHGSHHTTSSMIYHDGLNTCIPNTLVGCVGCFSSTITATGTIRSNDVNSYQLFQASNTTDTKLWSIQNLPTSGDFRIRAGNDAFTNGINGITISRTGISSVSVALGGNTTIENSGTFTVGSTAGVGTGILYASTACFASNVCVGGGLVAQNASTFCDTVGLFGSTPQLYIGATNGASNYTILKWCTTDKSLNIHNQSTGGSPQLVIACNGNVGIKTIAAPSYDLEVRGNIGILSSTSAGLVTTSTLCAAGTVTGLIRFDGLHTPSLTTYTGPSINACKDDANYATSLVFKTTDSSGGNNVNLRIAGTGTSTFSNSVNLSAIFSNGGAVGNYNAIELRGGTAGTAVNWQISKDNSTANTFELAASTTAGGTTYASPVFKILNTGIATFTCQICAPAFIGGTISGTTIYGNTAVCSPVGKFTTCIDAGSGIFSSCVGTTALNMNNMASLGSIGGGAIYLPYTAGLLFRSADGSTAKGKIQADNCNNLFLNSDNGGYVGIGTTCPIQKLHIAASSNPYIRIDDTGVASEGGLIMQPTGYNAKGGLTINYATGELKLFTGEINNGYFQTFYTNGVERMRIACTGAATFYNSITSLIDIAGIQNQLILENLNTAAGADGNSIYFKGYQGSLAKISAYGIPTQQVGGYLQLQSYSDNTTANIGLIINQPGNVGIGTTNPTYRLEVCGGSSQVSSFVKHINGDGINTSFVNLCSNGYSSYIYIGSSPGTDWKLGKNVLNTGSCTYFQIVDSSNNLRLQINSSDGNVGIGTASPAYKLDVNGNVGAGFYAGQCMTLSSWSSNSGLILNYGNASGQVTAINLQANGVTNGYIGMQMVDSSNGDLWLGGYSGRSITLYRTGNTGFKTNTPCTGVHVEGGYGATFGCGYCFYGGGYAGGGFPYGDIYGNGSAYTYQTANTTATNGSLFGGYAAGYFKGGPGSAYGGGGAGVLAIGGDGANAESVNSGGGAGLFARGGKNGAGTLHSYAAWFDGGDVVVRCGNLNVIGNEYIAKSGGGGSFKQTVVGQTTAAASGVAKKIAYVGYSHSVRVYVWANQSAANGSSAIADITTLYGASSGGTTAESSFGTTSDIVVAYDNAGSPAYTINVTLTYSGAAPTINYVVEGINHDNNIYTIA